MLNFSDLYYPQLNKLNKQKNQLKSHFKCQKTEAGMKEGGLWL